ncbi:MAG: 3-hydroxyacyl-CoA dehydrogenase/enoyl-CoA hydratase family protein [Arenicellales bacterium]|nr:3-hydroxyacyl-CoA dehydrogenase/enoyl-CoA hydratase family protein [Arenicellales bacterium]
MISKVAVLGAGTMGTGIAGQLANADVEVLLLDIKQTGVQPNAVAERAIKRLQDSDPPLLVHPDVLTNITIGNIDDDLNRISSCDWIIEAIVERLELKRELYQQINRYRKPDAIVSSNTSTIPMTLLTQDMPASFRQHFAITHFFNPVRYMRLLELVKGDETTPAVMETLRRFNEEKMGKGIVDCRDTPGFLANRVGVFALQVGIDETVHCGLNIEEADALMGRPMGIPKTGVFGLYDLIGLDLMADVVKSLKNILPDTDPFQQVSNENHLVNKLISEGYTGLKGHGGFYRRVDSRRESIDLATGQWRPYRYTPPSLVADDMQNLVLLTEGDTPQHQFCRRVLGRVLAYSAGLLPEVTDHPVPIDDAMKLGYNWAQGPFEMIDAIGISRFIHLLKDEGIPVPPYLAGSDHLPCYRVEQGQLQTRYVDTGYQTVRRAPGIVRFNETRRTLQPLSRNASASLYKLSEGVGLIEFHSKANALDGDSMAIVEEAALRAGDDLNGIIVHNDGLHFSAGVNLHRFRAMIEDRNWDGIDSFLVDFQRAVKALKYCAVPVIAAPSGLTIGGGYEVAAHCDVVVTHTNVVLGLVESLVGLVPAGGGVKDTLFRWHHRLGDWNEAAQKSFMNIGYGRTGTSPKLAAELAYFRPNVDRQVINRDRLVQASLDLIRNLADDYNPPEKPTFHWVGRGAFEQMQDFLQDQHSKCQLTAHDVVVGTEIARIVTGGDRPPTEISENELYDAERMAFVRLAKTEATHARIIHMLDRGQALRN